MRRAAEVFGQQNGEVTKAYYAELAALGPLGEIAVCLFRAHKRSTAAKSYRGGRFRGAAYDVKQWSIGELCRRLQSGADCFGIRWGWKSDPGVLLRGDASWVLYVDLPQGQCSFHSPARGEGPAYAGEWDGNRGGSEAAILAFCDSVAGVVSECAGGTIAGPVSRAAQIPAAPEQMAFFGGPMR